MSWVAVGVAGASVVGSVAGSLISSDANSRAAQQASQAQLQGAQIQAQAIRDAQAANERYAREAQAVLEAQRAEEGAGLPYLRGVVANPGDLTPAQQARLDDLRRSVGNQIRTSSIAGSGRTARSLLRQSETDFVNQALEANRDRAFSAATGMAGRAGNATTGIANIASGLGKSSADLISKGGEVMGTATTRAGMYGPQADIANAQLTGRAIGDVGSVIATQGRLGRYGSGSLTPTTTNAPVGVVGSAGDYVVPTFY